MVRQFARQEFSVDDTTKHVPIHQVDYFLGPNTLFIVMEFADGGDLSSLIKERQKQKRHFSEDQVSALV